MHELIVNFFHALKKACSVSSAMAYSVAAAPTLLIVIRAAGLKLPPVAYGWQSVSMQVLKDLREVWQQTASSFKIKKCLNVAPRGCCETAFCFELCVDKGTFTSLCRLTSWFLLVAEKNACDIHRLRGLRGFGLCVCDRCFNVHRPHVVAWTSFAKCS